MRDNPRGWRIEEAMTLCAAFGVAPQDALENVYDAIGCWMEAAREMGRPIPEPRRAAA